MSQEISEHKVKQSIILDSKVAELDVTGNIYSPTLCFGGSHSVPLGSMHIDGYGHMESAGFRPGST